MRILFLGGDRRQLEIIKDLQERKHVVDVIGYKNINLDVSVNKKEIGNINIGDYDVIIFPVNGVREDYSITTTFDDNKTILHSKLLMGCKDKVKIYSGIMTKELEIMLQQAGKTAHILMNDDDIKKKNSVPTVEGIISDIVQNTDFTINNAKIFVIGYGNIGKLLVEYLMKMGANVTVGIIEDRDYEYLAKHYINCLYTTNYIRMTRTMANSDVVINTVPSLVIDDEYLKAANKDIYIIDISSKPHGIDFEAANKYHIRTKLYQGIPAVVAPKTAGRILSRKINDEIGGEL